MKEESTWPLLGATGADAYSFFAIDARSSTVELLVCPLSDFRNVSQLRTRASQAASTSSPFALGERCADADVVVDGTGVEDPLGDAVIVPAFDVQAVTARATTRDRIPTRRMTLDFTRPAAG
jgi:hypothetical protein